MNAGQLQTRVLERLDQPGGQRGYYTEAETLDAINEGIRFFTLLTLGLEGTATISLDADTTFYHMQPLIPDWMLPLRVRLVGVGTLRPARLDELDAVDRGWQSKAGPPSRYAALGFDFFAVYKQPASGSLEITYARRPAPLVLATDVPEYPEDLHPAFADYGVYRNRFREGGQEFAKTLPYLRRFLDEAKRYGNYIRARNIAGRYDKMPFQFERADLSKLLKLRADLPPVRKTSNG